jgi:hypothetical protein
LTVLVVFDHLSKMNSGPRAISGLNPFDGAPRAEWMHPPLRLRGGLGGFVAKNLAVQMELPISYHINRKNLP